MTINNRAKAAGVILERLRIGLIEIRNLAEQPQRGAEQGGMA